MSCGTRIKILLHPHSCYLWKWIPKTVVFYLFFMHSQDVHLLLEEERLLGKSGKAFEHLFLMEDISDSLMSVWL